MNSKCPDCGKEVRVDSQRIPASGDSVKCPQCNHATKVSPETAVPAPLFMSSQVQGLRRSGKRIRGFQAQWFLMTGIVVEVLLLCVCLWGGLNLRDGDDKSYARHVSFAHPEPQVQRSDIETLSEPMQSPSGIDASVTSVAGTTVPVPALLRVHPEAKIEAPAVSQIPVVATDQNDPAAELLRTVGLTRHVDESTWREQLPDRFAQATVPGSNNGFGGREAMFLEVDAWGDNAALASVFYEVPQVMSSEGHVLNGCVGAREKMVGQRIRVPVQHGTQMGEALIRFDVSVPKELSTAVLDVSAGHEVTGDMATGSVAIVKVADQIVRLVYKDMAMPFVYAFDRLGNGLRRERISREYDGVHLVFGGTVETCLIVGIQEEMSHTFETRVALNPAQAVALSYEPEVPPYTRFDPTPLVSYADVSSLDVNDLTVHWFQEEQQSHFRQLLSVDLPENVAVQPHWEVYAHQRDNKVRLNGSSVVNYQRAAYQCRTPGSREVDQISGSVLLHVSGRIKRVILDQQALNHPCCVNMPKGKYLDVHVDKNKLSYMVLGGDVVQLAAYDNQGRRLRQDPAWRFQQGMKSVYFWGLPEKVVLDIATQIKVAKLNFTVAEPLEQESQPLFTTSVQIPNL